MRSFLVITTAIATALQLPALTKGECVGIAVSSCNSLVEGTVGCQGGGTAAVKRCDELSTSSECVAQEGCDWVGDVTPGLAADVPEEENYVVPENFTLVEQVLVASDGVEDDYFGKSVAMDGDTLLIGSHYDMIGDVPKQGSAYIFERDRVTMQWVETQKLVANDVEPDEDWFGESAALQGDTALVGAWGDDSGDGDYGSGSVYVFQRNATTGLWVQTQKLLSPDPNTIGRFGDSVSIDGDTMVIGERSGEGGALDDTGSVHVFTRSSSPDALWEFQTTLVYSQAMEDDEFGQSVGLSGDTIVVGAKGSYSSTHAGYAVVFERTIDGWDDGFVLSPADGQVGDEIGHRVGISGDTICVANGELGSTERTYIYEREYLPQNQTSWTLLQTLDYGFTCEVGGNLLVAYNNLFIRNGATGIWEDPDIELKPSSQSYPGLSYKSTISGLDIAIGYGTGGTDSAGQVVVYSLVDTDTLSSASTTTTTATTKKSVSHKDQDKHKDKDASLSFETAPEAGTMSLSHSNSACWDSPESIAGTFGLLALSAVLCLF